MEFSLCFFGCPPIEGAAPHDYRLLLEAARFADGHGLAAVWTPERHFHRFGGLFPNPAIAAAAMAACTRRIGLRAGSVVLPLHDPLAVAEDWATVDALSGGRTGISFASGWHDQDFVLSPGSYPRRRELLWERIEEFRHVWAGGTTWRIGPDGSRIEVRIQPRPVQGTPPVWVTAAGSMGTFERAGAEGFHVLTHLLGMDLAGLRQRIDAYRAARGAAGHDPAAGRVTLMIHTCLAPVSPDKVRQAMKGFLSESLDLLRHAATPWSFGAYRAGPGGPADPGQAEADLGQLGSGDRDAILEHSVDRYLHGLGLFGTPDTASGTIETLRDLGVDEVACLIDFGLAEDKVLAGLPGIETLQERFRAQPPRREPERGPESVRKPALPLTQDRDGAGPIYPAVKSMWCSILGIEEALPDSNFFDLGGHSLHAMRLANQVRTRWAYDLPLATLFGQPTLAEVARHIEQRVRDRSHPASS